MEELNDPDSAESDQGPWLFISVMSRRPERGLESHRLTALAAFPEGTVQGGDRVYSDLTVGWTERGA